MEGPCSLPLFCKGWSDDAVRAETSRILLKANFREKFLFFSFFKHHLFYVQAWGLLVNWGITTSPIRGMSSRKKVCESTQCYL